MVNSSWRLPLAFLACAGIVTGGAVLVKLKAADDGAREIRLVARDMSYRLEDSAGTNPTLRLHRGERVRFVLTNDDAGYAHNLVAPVLDVSTPLIQHGHSQSVEVTVPDVPGVSAYACGPHGQMMRGNIVIE
jgi:plastocyanin